MAAVVYGSYQCNIKSNFLFSRQDLYTVYFMMHIDSFFKNSLWVGYFSCLCPCFDWLGGLWGGFFCCSCWRLFWLVSFASFCLKR